MDDQKNATGPADANDIESDIAETVTSLKELPEIQALPQGAPLEAALRAIAVWLMDDADVGDEQPETGV